MMAAFNGNQMLANAVYNAAAQIAEPRLPEEAFALTRETYRVMGWDFYGYCRDVVRQYPEILERIRPFTTNPARFVALCAEYYLDMTDEGYETGSSSEPETEEEDPGFESESSLPSGEHALPTLCIDCDSSQCTCRMERDEVVMDDETIVELLLDMLNKGSVVDLDTVDKLRTYEKVFESQGNVNTKGQAQNQANGNFGTVINNYYQNQYQGSIDMSGVTAGDKPASTATGLVDAATSAFATMAPMLLDQNTEEVTQLSDRILTQVEGNSAVNTQSTVGRMIGYGKVSDPTQPTSCGDKATTGQPATDRFFTYRMAPWTQTETTYQWMQLRLPEALSNADDGGVFSQNLARHYSLKCGWKAQVQCNASNFHSGALLVFFAPEWTNDKPDKQWQALVRTNGIQTSWNSVFGRVSTSGADQGRIQACDLGYTTPEQWTLFPHQVLNLRTGTTVDLEVPFVNVTPTSDHSVHNPWTLVIAVLTPLSYAAGASTQIEITVSIAPVNPVWNGLRQPAISQGPIPVAVRENPGQFTTTLPDNTTPLYGLLKNRPVDYLAGEITDLVSLAKIPCYMSFGTPTVRIPYFEVGNSIPTEPVQTFNVVLSCRCLVNTMVGTMSYYYSQYRGSLNYNFLFTGTAMMKLKMLIAYTPPGAGVPTSIEQAMQGTYAIWDIGLNSTWIFTVPFISVSDWRYTQQAASNALNSDGWVTVWQLTPLTYPPGNPTTARIVVSASAGDDFSFRNPIFTGMLLSQGTDNAEKGEVHDQDASDDQLGKSLDVENSHTKLSFFFDRSRALGMLLAVNPRETNVIYPQLFDANGLMISDSAGNGVQQYMNNQRWGRRVMRLSAHPSVGIYQIPFFFNAGIWDRTFWNLAPFTYFRADLEVTVVPYGAGVDPDMNWTVHWTPCGAPIDQYRPDFQYSGTNRNVDGFEALPQGMISLNPMATGRGANAVSFQIPWNSPQTVSSTQFSGYSSYSKLKGEYGQAPANFWGWIQIAIQTYSYSDSMFDPLFMVYVRYKNMRAWIPRPVFSRPFPANTSRVRFAGIDGPRRSELAAQARVVSEDDVIKKTLVSEGCWPLNPKIRDLNFDLRVNDTPAVGFAKIGDIVYATISHKKTFRVVPNVHASHPLLDCRHIAKVYNDWLQCQLDCSIWHYVNMQSQGAGMSTDSSGHQPSFRPNHVPPPHEVDPATESSVYHLLNALEADGSAETLKEGWNAIKMLKEEWAKLKETVSDPTFWTSVVMAIIKLLISTYVFFESSSAGKVAMAAYGFVVMTEWSGLIDMLKDYFKRTFKTDPPEPPIMDVYSVSYQKQVKEFKERKGMTSQGPFDTISKQASNLNQWFNAGKNVEWLVKKIKELIDWIKTWFDEEQKTPKQRLADLIVDLPSWISEVHEYREGKRPQVSDMARKGIQEVYDLAVQCGSSGLASFLERFRQIWTHCSARTEPVVIVLRGKPGRGKSVAAQILAQGISKVMTGHQSVYSFPPDSKYFDGYSGQYCMIMDDLGQNPDGEDFKVFCQMVSTTHFVPNMAALDQKGTSFQTQVIIATTNQTDFRPVTVADPQAVARRVTFDFEVYPNGTIADKDGRLDLDEALDKLDEPATAPFAYSCPIITQLCFRPRNVQNKIYTLPEVMDKTCNLIKYKKECSNALNLLISQGLSLKVEDPVLEATLENLNKYIEHLEKHRDSVARLRSDAFILMKWLLGVCATLATVFAVKKLLSPNDATRIEPPNLVMTPKMIVVGNDSEAGTSAYDGKARKSAEKKELKVLNLENGNPQLDFELYCAQKVVYRITFTDGEQVAAQSAIAVCERVFVTNAHVWKGDWAAFTINGMSFKRDQGYDVFEVHKKGVSTDVVFVRLGAGPMFKNNVSKFAEGAPKKGLEVTGVTHFAEIPLLYEGQVVSDISSMNTNTGLYNNVFRYTARTRKGYCGSAVIGIEGNAKRIFGMHSAGADGLCGAALLQRSMIQRVLKHFGVETAKMESQGLIIKRPDGPFVHVSRKTQLKKTLAYNVFQPEFGPAALSKYDQRLDPDVDLDEKIFSKHTRNQSDLPAVASIMAKEYANQVFSQIGRDNGRTSVQDAILGYDGLEKMEPNTSPGLPYTLKGKRRTDLIDFENGLILDDGLRNEIQLMHQKWFEDHTFQTFLKDEVRPLDKVRQGKTRIVDVASVGHCIVGRQLLGRFASKYQTRPGFGIGSAIGCNPDVDWTKFYYQAKDYKYVYDVDYSNFDASHGTAIFEVLKQEFFNTANGFDPLIWPYLDSLAHSNHAYEDKRFRLVGGLPSGCSSTSVLNTVMNNIVIRTGLALTYENFDFYDVAVLAYGDDLLLATNFELDLNLLKTRMQEMGYTITPANKGSVFAETMQIEEASFLKRRFVPDDCRPCLIRPVMEKKNLEAMLSFYRPGTMTERLKSIVQLAVHSGKETYDWLFQPFRERNFLIPLWETANRRWHSLFL